MLVSLRIAEIGEHPVTHILGDEAACLGDEIGAASAVCSDDLAHVLGVESRRECGRADKVAKQYRQLAALGCILVLRLRDGGRLSLDGRVTGKFPDGAQHLQPVPKRNAEVLEVLIGQLWQNISVDFIAAKRSFILPESEAAQPSPDIHAGHSNRP
jgi:hypothetical protein